MKLQRAVHGAVLPSKRSGGFFGQILLHLPRRQIVPFVVNASRQALQPPFRGDRRALAEFRAGLFQKHSRVCGNASCARSARTRAHLLCGRHLLAGRRSRNCGKSGLARLVRLFRLVRARAEARVLLCNQLAHVSIAAFPARDHHDGKVVRQSAPGAVHVHAHLLGIHIPCDYAPHAVCRSALAPRAPRQAARLGKTQTWSSCIADMSCIADGGGGLKKAVRVFGRRSCTPPQLQHLGAERRKVSQQNRCAPLGPLEEQQQLHVVEIGAASEKPFHVKNLGKCPSHGKYRERQSLRSDARITQADAELKGSTKVDVALHLVQPSWQLQPLGKFIRLARRALICAVNFAAANNSAAATNSAAAANFAAANSADTRRDRIHVRVW